jgi:DNA-binding HxlR family transcriptional regulator
MAKRDVHFNCGIDPAFAVIGGKWKALILWELHGATRRFGELKRLVPGITEKMLILTIEAWCCTARPFQRT